MPTATIAFRGERFFLSNFSPCPNGVRIDDIRYPTSEHAYQALKSTEQEVHLMMASLPTPGHARRMGRNIKAREDWEQVKVDVMRRVLRAKFTQNHDLRAQLMETTDELVEVNTWGDRFWGQSPAGNGENWLGRLLMEERGYWVSLAGMRDGA